MAIFIWGGEKNPLAALFPPCGPYLRLSTGLVGPSVKFIPPEIHTDADNHRTTLPRNETSKKKAAQSIQIGPKPNSTGEVKSASSWKKVMHVDNNQPSYGTNDEPAEGDGEQLGKGIQNYYAPIMPDSSSEAYNLNAKKCEAQKSNNTLTGMEEMVTIPCTTADEASTSSWVKTNTLSGARGGVEVEVIFFSLSIGG